MGCLFSAVSSAALWLTRLKPRGPPREGTHQKQGPMQPFREDVEEPKDVRSLGALPWANRALAVGFVCS